MTPCLLRKFAKNGTRYRQPVSITPLSVLPLVHNDDERSFGVHVVALRPQHRNLHEDTHKWSPWWNALHKLHETMRTFIPGVETFRTRVNYYCLIAPRVTLVIRSMTFQARTVIFYNKFSIIWILSIFIHWTGAYLHFLNGFFSHCVVPNSTIPVSHYLTFYHSASMTRFTVSPVDPVILTLYAQCYGYSDTIVL